MHTRAREHSAYARNVLEDAAHLLSQPDSTLHTAGLRCLELARDEIRAAINLVCAGVAAGRAKHLTLDEVAYFPANEPPTPHLTVDEVEDYQRRLQQSLGGPLDGAEDEILASISNDHAIEMPAPAAPRHPLPRGRYRFDAQSRRLVALGGTLSSPGRTAV